MKEIYCESCLEYSNKKTIATHIQEPDPYQSEINDDDTPCNLCDDCYHDSCMDI